MPGRGAKLDSNANSSDVPSGAATNQCRAAITAAQTASNASNGQASWVYAIAYGASNSSGCNTDTPAITPCAAMQGIASKNGASDPTKFYSDASLSGSAKCTSSAHPSITDLNSIFTAISRDLQTSRLLE